MLRRLRARSTGFTIIELLVVIVIIGILAAIITVIYTDTVNRARDAAVLSDAEVLAGEVTRYSVQHDGEYGTAVEWYSGGSANANIEFTPSDGNIVDVVASEDDYCIRVFHPNALQYNTLNTAAVKESSSGICDYLEPSTIAATEHPSISFNKGIVTTLAGSGVAGFANGTGSATQFNYPNDITIDSAGNLFVADPNNDRIRKITPAGVVTTFAGSGVEGHVDATGTSAQFTAPNFIAIDASDNLYVSDGHRIRKITPAGVVTTIAGNGTAGFADATGASAQFNGPSGLDIATDGTIYVADNSNTKIRKITTGGVVTTLAGSTFGYVDATGSAARFLSPSDILIDDSNGDIYVADTDNSVIRKVTPAGVVTTFAGSSYGYQDGGLLSAEFMEPRSLAFDSHGRMYVMDRYNKRIRMISDGQVTTIAGSGSSGYVDGKGEAASFNPEGLTTTPSGTLYVADRGNHVIRKVR